MELNSERKIGVVISNPEIPEVTQGEISELERQAVPLHILSLHPPKSEAANPYTHVLHSPVSYASAENGALISILQAHVRLLARRPIRYISALSCLIWCAERGRLRMFFKAVWLARQSAQANVVHLHAYYAGEMIRVAEWARRLTGISLSITVDTDDMRSTPQQTLRRKLGDASFAITHPERVERNLDSPVLPAIPVKRAYRALDTTRYRSQRQHTRSERSPLILSVGRLSESSGFVTLMRACRILHSLGHRFRCEIVGDGPDLPRLRASVGALGLDCMVTLTRRLPHHVLMERYRSASLLALPCQDSEHGEGDGIRDVLFQAMAMELPVVATPVLGIPEIIEHETNGLLAAPENPAALANEIQRLLRQPLLRARLGAAGPQTIRHAYPVNANAEQLRDLLTNATAVDPKQPALPPLREELMPSKNVNELSI